MDTQSLLDAGGAHIWFVLPTAMTGGPLMFLAGPITLPGGGEEELQFHMDSTLLKLQEHEMPHGTFCPVFLASTLHPLTPF